jgi:hypothetical protein
MAIDTAKFRAPTGIRKILANKDTNVIPKEPTATYTQQPDNTFTMTQGGEASPIDTEGVKNIETVRGTLRSTGNVMPTPPPVPSAVAPSTVAPEATYNPTISKPVMQGPNPTFATESSDAMRNFNRLSEILADPFARNMYRKSHLQAIGGAVQGGGSLFSGVARGLDTGQNAAEAGMFSAEQSAASEAQKTAAMVQQAKMANELGYADIGARSADRGLARTLSAQEHADSMGFRKLAAEQSQKALDWEMSPDNPKNQKVPKETEFDKARVQQLIDSGAPLTPESQKMLNQGFVYKKPSAEERAYLNPMRYFKGAIRGEEGGWINPSTGNPIRKKAGGGGF